MSSTPSSPQFQGGGSGFDSIGCEIVIFDGPGDTTVRPAPPVLRDFCLRERERLKKWLEQASQEQPPSSEQTDEGDAQNSEG
jgi:hypothetical protein